jgi:hypothetical protein
VIYWYTGQPGHGKTLHAIDKLLQFKEEGRIVYACNVRQFDYEKTGVLPMTPEQFRDWMTFLPDGAVALVDEAYEHDMLPKRPPGAKVPPHVEQLAKHRHRGLDFIFVSQSPDKQCDQFVHDLIERHVHVRRKFGSKWVQLREFERFEANAERALPIVNRNVHLLKGKRSVGTYKSTELDTTERRIPWYYYAFGLGIPAALALFWYVFGNLGNRLTGEALPTPAHHTDMTTGASEAHGARATGAAARVLSTEEYVAALVPRVPSQPWSAPIYDSKLSVSSEPPRLFCMLADPGEMEGGYRENSSCTCLTEQGTRYRLEISTCATIAREGQYEPFFQERGDQRHVDGYSQQQMLRADMRSRNISETVTGSAGTAPEPSVAAEFGTITRSAP